jgi:hypothetical protein
MAIFTDNQPRETHRGSAAESVMVIRSMLTSLIYQPLTLKALAMPQAPSSSTFGFFRLSVTFEITSQLEYL